MYKTAAIFLAAVFIAVPSSEAHVVSKKACGKVATKHVKQLKEWNRSYDKWRLKYKQCIKRGRQHRWRHKVPPILHRIARCESGGSYRAENPRSSASGRYQFLDSTWGGHGGYSRAKYAPPWVQDRKAVLAFQRRGTQPWAASSSCWGK